MQQRALVKIASKQKYPNLFKPDWQQTGHSYVESKHSESRAHEDAAAGEYTPAVAIGVLVVGAAH